MVTDDMRVALSAGWRALATMEAALRLPVAGSLLSPFLRPVASQMQAALDALEDVHLRVSHMETVSGPPPRIPFRDFADGKVVLFPRSATGRGRC